MVRRTTVRKVALVLNGVIALLLIGLLVALTRLRNENSSADAGLPPLGTLADFSLTNSAGEAFGLPELRGKVWVADFIFTSCAGICPTLSANMSDLHKKLAARDDVHFVSVSVDPDTDTPEVLTGYAAKYSADTSKWHFLTGSEERIHELAVTDFKVGSIDDPLIHSNKFVLVDGEGTIRGYYAGTERDDLKRLDEDIRKLVDEQP